VRCSGVRSSQNFWRTALKDWKKDAQTVFMAVTESENKKHEVSREPEVRLFISSLSFDNPNIAALGYRAIREHWHIENKLHWCLDMDFGQDHMQIKNRNYVNGQVLITKELHGEDIAIFQVI
jgi:predicted transposase YbfD/YdcC